MRSFNVGGEHVGTIANEALLTGIVPQVVSKKDYETRGG